MKNFKLLLVFLLIGAMLLLASCAEDGSVADETENGSGVTTHAATDVATDAVTEGDAVVDTDAVTEGDAVVDTDAVTEGDAVVDTEAVTEGDAVVDTEAETEGDAVVDTEAETDGVVGGEETNAPSQVLPLPEGVVDNAGKQSVIGAIVQIGDGNAYVNGSIPAPQRQFRTQSLNQHLVTFEHAFGNTCCVSGYMGNSLYIIQDFGSLGWNKKGIGHKDGTVLLEYGENGYFSISALSENKVIVGHPTDESVESLWAETGSYLFGYLIYDEDAKTLTPMYAENNLRFYTAGYFINGVALVSVKQDGKILFGVIDAQGNYVVEPQYQMMADESFGNMVIVGLEAEVISPENSSFADDDRDTCGRSIGYDSTLMTNVQSTRAYECTSQSVGIINTVTGETVLPCVYSYIERVLDDLYFVINNEGGRFLYRAGEEVMSVVEEGFYACFNAEYMLFVDGNGVLYLADKELQLYDASMIHDYDVMDITRNPRDVINTNVISARRNEQSQRLISGTGGSSGILEEYDIETCLYKLTIMATGVELENVRSYAHPYNGGFLYTVENSLYRYDLETQTSTRLETGYGNYTEDYENRGESYYAQVYELDTGIFVLNYNTEFQSGGSTYHRIIINDKGTVLFEAEVNDIERLYTNYLGKYDDALYAMAGMTRVEDNYFLTRSDGSHFLIQFVRGEATDSGATDGESLADDTRVVDSLSTFALLSPFMLDFADGSEISVTIGDVAVPSDCYVYNPETQSLKLLAKVFDLDNSLLETMRADGFMAVSVTAGDEAVSLKILVSPFAMGF